jgi:hypothetical protein
MPVLTRRTSCSLKTVNLDAEMFYSRVDFVRGVVKNVPCDKINRDFYVYLHASCAIGGAVACARMADGLRKYLETGELDDNLHEYEDKSNREIVSIIKNTYGVYEFKLSDVYRDVALYLNRGIRPSFITRDSEWNC